MIALLAAGMAAQAMGFLAAADLVALGPELWDSFGLQSPEGLVGRILHTLTGYMDRPTATQAVACLATLLMIQRAARTVAGRQRRGEGRAAAAE